MCHLFSPDDKLKIGNAEILTDSGKHILGTLYLCIAKQLFITCSLVLKDHIVFNRSDVVLQIDNSTVTCECPITLSTFLPKINFVTQITF